MKRFTFLIPLLFPIHAATAQIHADVTVSSDGEPLGTFRILLHHDKAPRTVANFIGLATGERASVNPKTGAVQFGKPYYDGLIFHRLVHDFIIQGGCPLGTGSSGPGYVFQDEYDPSLRHSAAYTVSMANSGVNSNGSQFFITFAPTSFLDDLHSIFGTVIDDDDFPNSRAVIDAFTSAEDFPTDTTPPPSGGEPSHRPLTPPVIDSIVISGPDLEDFDIHDPALELPRVTGLPIRLRHDADESKFFLVWDRLRKWDYPFYLSNDLATWNWVVNMLSMDNQSSQEVEVTGLFFGSRGFLTMAAIDYTHTPNLPVNVFADGSTFEFELNYGELTLEFGSPGVGNWTFIDPEEAETSGSFSYEFAQDIALFGIPETGFFFDQDIPTLARSLAAREVTVFLDGDGAFGPDEITALQPQLSFHSDNTGWFNGPTNSNQPNTIFRGKFTRTAPAE